MKSTLLLCVGRSYLAPRLHEANATCCERHSRSDKIDPEPVEGQRGQAQLRGARTKYRCDGQQPPPLYYPNGSCYDANDRE